MADDCCAFCCFCAICFACLGDKGPFCCGKSNRAANDAAIDMEYAARFGNEELKPDAYAPERNETYRIGQRQPAANDMQMPNPETGSGGTLPMTSPPNGAHGTSVNNGAAVPDSIDPDPKHGR